MSIIAVSDVHLGTKDAKEKEFMDFLNSLDYEQIDDLVLLGDIVDIWRRDFTNVIMETSATFELLEEIKDRTRVHYIVGNHDFYFLRMKEVMGDRFPFEVKRSTVITSVNTNFYFIHGYQLEVLCNPYYKSLQTYETFSEHLCLAGDDTGNAADALWKLYSSSKSWIKNLKKLPEHIDLALKSMLDKPEKRLKGEHKAMDSIGRLAESDARHVIFGINPQEFLIYGHTHRPYVDLLGRVANTGCWGVEDEDKCNYIEIIDDVPHIRSF